MPDPCLNPTSRISLALITNSDGTRGLQADVVPSAEVDNGVELAADGLYVQGPGRTYSPTGLPEDSTNYAGRMAYVSFQDGTMWQFRWNAGSSKTYKWQFVGGPWLLVSQESQGTIAASGGNDWQDLHATDPNGAGPDIVVPVTGIYQVKFWGRLKPATAASTTQIGVSVAGADPDVNFQVATMGAGGTNANGTHVGKEFWDDGTVYNRGDRLRLLYRDDASSGTAEFDHRGIAILPVRVHGG